MRPPRLSLTLRFQHQYPHSPHTQNGVFVMLHRSPTSGGKPPSRERCDVVQSQLEISSSCLISILITIVNTVAFSSSTQIRPRQIGPLVIFCCCCGKLGPSKSCLGKLGPWKKLVWQIGPLDPKNGKLAPQKCVAQFATKLARGPICQGPTCLEPYLAHSPADFFRANWKHNVGSGSCCSGLADLISGERVIKK